MRGINWVGWVSLVTSCIVALVMPFLVLKIENAHQDTNNTIRQLVCSFEKESLQGATAEERRQIVRFYENALARIGESPCT